MMNADGHQSLRTAFDDGNSILRPATDTEDTDGRGSAGGIMSDNRAWTGAHTRSIPLDPPSQLVRRRRRLPQVFLTLTLRSVGGPSIGQWSHLLRTVHEVWRFCPLAYRWNHDTQAMQFKGLVVTLSRRHGLGPLRALELQDGCR